MVGSAVDTMDWSSADSREATSTVANTRASRFPDSAVGPLSSSGGGAVVVMIIVLPDAFGRVHLSVGRTAPTPAVRNAQFSWREAGRDAEVGPGRWEPIAR